MKTIDNVIDYMNIELTYEDGMGSLSTYNVDLKKHLPQEVLVNLAKIYISETRELLKLINDENEDVDYHSDYVKLFEKIAKINID